MKIIEKFYEAINSFIYEYQKNPFNFLFERDLQSLLFATLFNLFSSDPVEIRGGYVSTKYPGPIPLIKTNPVKCEYPVTWRFDVAILDSNRVTHFDQRVASLKGWKSDPFWNQPVRAAAEIKYCQLGELLARKVRGIKLDLNKLREYSIQFPEFLGISLIFIQSESLKREPLYSDHVLTEDEHPEVGLLRYVVTPSKVERFRA